MAAEATLAAVAEPVMSPTLPKRMTADEFLVWAMEQPDGQRYELVAGELVAMSPEPIGHGRAKFRLARRLAEAIETADLPCEVFVDRMSVRVDDRTVYEPDILLQCGGNLDPAATEVNDPLVLVEVISPSSYRRDTGGKLEDYFRVKSVRHYLIVKTENQAIIHHRRDDAGAITTSIIRDGTIRLDPPGIVVTDVFRGLSL